MESGNRDRYPDKSFPMADGWAYALYILLVLAFIITVTKLYFRTKYNKKALALSEKQRLHEQEINQQKIDFYGNISHELRTPLTLINGNIELLAHGALNEDNEHKLITTLSYNSNRLLRLVNQLLDFSRMGNETIPVARHANGYRAAHPECGRLVPVSAPIPKRSIIRCT